MASFVRKDGSGHQAGGEVSSPTDERGGVHP